MDRQITVEVFLKVIRLSFQVNSKVSFVSHSYGVSFLEAVEPTREKIFTDPCAPKGYNLDTKTQKHLSGLLAEKSRFSDSFQAGGNYSECRSAARTILQEGNGRILVGIAGFPFIVSVLLLPLIDTYFCF